MWRILLRHENDSHQIAGIPLINLMLVSGLAACSAGGAPGAPDSGGMGAPGGVMNVADAAIAGGDPEMALRVSQSVLATDPHNLDALYHEGEAYYVVNRCMDAIAVYKVALSVDPSSSDAELGIGRCLLKQDAGQAEQAFAAAVHDDPDNAKAYNDLGIARDLQGNHAGAVGPYQQALLLDPGNIATEVNIGMSLALSGNGDEALQYLGPLATSPQATPKIREDYAAALVAAGRQEEARGVLAIDLTPDQVAPLLNDFATAIAAGQAPVAPQAGSPPVASASAPTAPVAAQAAMPAMAPAPVVETALASPPAASQPAASLPVLSPPAALPAAVPPPAPTVVAAMPPSALPAVMPPPAPTESAAAAPPALPGASVPPSAIAAAIAAASLPAAVAPAPPPVKIAAADPPPQPAPAADPPAPTVVASLPAIAPPLDSIPSDAAPQPVVDVPAPTPPPAPRPAIAAPASIPAPAAQKPARSWWNLLRAPTAVH